jgi:YidC/Oxa1 family membrane protein insertase
MLQILKQFWNTLFVVPILNALIFLAGATGYLSLAIIILTVAIRLLLIPLVLPSMKNMKKQRELQPELDKIKKKYKNNKKKQAEAQMALFKEHGFSPMSGCLSQIPMLFILFALFGAIRIISDADGLLSLSSYLYFDPSILDLASVSNSFLIWDLTEADRYHIMPILVGAIQLLISKLTFGFTTKAQEVAKKTPDKSDDMAYNMQKQMLYTMPVFMVVISWSMPVGVLLYIITTSLFMLVQTYMVYDGDYLKKWLKKK